MWKASQELAALGLSAGLLILMSTTVTMAQGPLRLKPRPVQAPKKPAEPVLNRIDISVDSEKTTGDALKLQEEIARQFSRQDFCPEERLAQFAWLRQLERDGKRGFMITGWFGSIQKITKTREGWLVKVSVNPRMANGGTVVGRIADIYYEEYQYSPGSLHFLKAIVPPGEPGPRVITFN